MTGAAPYLLTSIVSAAVPTVVVVPVLSNRVSKANEENDRVKKDLADAKDPGSNYFKQNFQELIKGYYDSNKSKFNNSGSFTSNQCYEINDTSNNEYWVCYKPNSGSQ